MQGDCVPGVFVPKLIEFWRAGQFPFDRLTKFYDMEDINGAVEAAERSGRPSSPARFRLYSGDEARTEMLIV